MTTHSFLILTIQNKSKKEFGFGIKEVYTKELLLFKYDFVWTKVYSCTHLLAPKLKPPVSPVVAGALEGVPKENDIFTHFLIYLLSFSWYHLKNLCVQ